MYQTLGKITTSVLGLISLIFITRYLGTTGYGDYSLVFAYLSFFTTFSDLGLQTQVVKEITHSTRKHILGTFLWLKIGLTLFSIIIALIVLLFFHYPRYLNYGITLGSIAVSIGSLTGYANTIFQANIKLGLLTIIDVITKALTVFCVIVFIYLHYSWYYLILSVAIGNFVGLLLSVWFSGKITPFSYAFDVKLGISLLQKSMILGIATTLSTIYFKLDTIMLSVLKGTTDVGIYSLAYKVFENMLVFWWFYLASFYPILSKLHGNRDFIQFKLLLRNSVGISILYSLVMIIAGIFGGKFLIETLGGKAFYMSFIPLQILVFSSLFFFVTSIYYYYYFLKGMVNILLICISISLIFNFVLNLIFIPTYSFIAASWITVATEAFLVVLYSIVWCLKKQTRILLR